jgi:hypothetical protein
MRLVKILVLAAVGLTLSWLVVAPVQATDVRVNINSPNHWAPPPARTPSVLRGGNPGIGRDDGHRRGHDHRGDHRHRPGVVFVAPRQCWQPGYWTHQWVPQAHTYNTWVAGQWSPDGRWIEGHYAPYVHHAGYYQPYWVEGYWVGC